MSNIFNRIVQDIANTNMENYWPSFELVAYAIYDKKDVYLFNHPKFNTDSDHTYHVLKWNEQFIGNTLILFEEFPTAIVNIELYDDYESLFSILIHELFHGYQYLIGEKRFPNEMMGMMYPLSLENVEIRNQERKNLFNALMANTFEDMKHNLNTFIALREKRKSNLEEFVLYENYIETCEGPAWYVELKAYSEKSSLTSNAILEKYGQGLIDRYASTLNIRRSCYSSGLFLCLILDEISPMWHEAFFASEKSLFEFFKDNFVDLKSYTIDCVAISEETKDIVNDAIENKEKVFNKFGEKRGVTAKLKSTVFAK